jgi:hypothetical protein
LKDIIMDCSVRSAAALVLGTATVFSLSTALHAQQPASVSSVQVLGNRTPLEIEIEGSDRLAPQAQVLTGPDRLVVDFAGAVPGAQLRNQKMGRSEVKGVRVGLLSAKPPVTRVVFDLNGPQAYQIFPSGRTVMVKVGSGAGLQTAGLTSSNSGAQLVIANYTAQSLKITPPEPPPLVVSFSGGLLTINSNKASLSEVLYAVHQRTGADIAIPAGAEQEKVVAAIGPASAPEVLSQLLNGSKFNFVILNSANDPAILDRVILSAKPEGPAPAYHPAPQAPVQDEPPPAAMEANTPPPPSQAPPANVPEVKNPPNGENPPE